MSFDFSLQITMKKLNEGCFVGVSFSGKTPRVIGWIDLSSSSDAGKSHCETSILTPPVSQLLLCGHAIFFRNDFKGYDYWSHLLPAEESLDRTRRHLWDFSWGAFC